MNEEVSKQVEELRGYHKIQTAMGKAMMEADGGAFYPLDFLAIAVLDRSQALIAGFCSMVEARNLVCAAPLVRLQIDNCLRFYAAFIVKDPHDFAVSVLKGVSVRKLRDRDNKLMTDRHLAEKLSEKYPWIMKLYEETSGYIHLSEKHIFNAITDAPGDRTVSFKISPEDIDVDDEVYIEATKAFKAATNVLLEHIHGWTYTKANPEKVAEMKRKLNEVKGTT
jgi:hypothetical protein